jgi:hypothetical protein
MTDKKITAKDLHYELEGVIADVEYGNGFDDVCLNTVKRVSNQLVSVQADADEADQVRKGFAITVPADKAHAEAMLSVALFYLEQFKEKDKVE